jgi:hypothetical protein
MATAAQITANQLNATHSTGPNPPSSLNLCRTASGHRGRGTRSIPHRGPRSSRQATLAGRERWIEKTVTGCARDGHYTDEREPLIARDLRITNNHTWPNTTLLVSHRWIKFNDDYGTPAELHARSSTQPSPGTHRTDVPALLSRSDSASSAGRLCDHASNSWSANSMVSGWGF